jgi:hypothetical protein
MQGSGRHHEPAGIRKRSVAALASVAADGSLGILGISAPLRATGLGWEPNA